MIFNTRDAWVLSVQAWCVVHSSVCLCTVKQTFPEAIPRWAPGGISARHAVSCEREEYKTWMPKLSVREIEWRGGSARGWSAYQHRHSLSSNYWTPSHLLTITSLLQEEKLSAVPLLVHSWVWAWASLWALWVVIRLLSRSSRARRWEWATLHWSNQHQLIPQTLTYLLIWCQVPPAPLREQMRSGYKATGAKAKGWAKQFGVLTALFGGVECVVEKYRAKHDVWNPVISGCAVGATLSASGGPGVRLSSLF